MTTWADLDPVLESLLGNASQVEPEDRIDYFNMALIHFASAHTAQLLTAVFDGDGSKEDFVMSTDLLDLYAIFSEDEHMFLEPKDFLPGIAWDTESGQASSDRPIGYIEWPMGTIHLFYPPETGVDSVKVWYFGLWTAIADNASIVEAPVWAHEPLLNYATAIGILAELSDAAVLNEYKTRVDSGKPTDNPFIQASDAWMKRYHDLLADRPKQVRAKAFRPGGRG